MPFTARDLRYHAEQNYSFLYGYLQRNAQRYLGTFQYDAFEVDIVVGHVVEQLVRLGLLGAKDTTSLNALDRMTDAQFYAFLHRSVRNKAIDRLRKRKLPATTFSDLVNAEGEGAEDRLEASVTGVLASTPLKTPEEAVLFIATQSELRAVLKHCIKELKSAPHQFQSTIEEMQKFGLDELVDALKKELPASLFLTEKDPNSSQQRDHAHKKLRLCLQSQNANLAVVVALRLIKYATRAATSSNYTVPVLTLAQHDMPEQQVRAGLKQLAVEKVLNWQGEDVVHLTTDQMKRLERFYREE